MRPACALLLLATLMLSCATVRGPCVRKETVSVEIDCREGGRSGSVRVPPVIQH